MIVIERIWRDVLYAARRFRKRPVFSSIVVLGLAVGLGSNAVIFSVLRATLLNPLPHPHPNELVMVQEVWPIGLGKTSWLTFKSLRQHTRSFEDLVAARYISVNAQRPSETQRINTLEVTANYFTALRSPAPLLGRYFIAGEDDPGAPRVVVLTEGLWRDFYESDHTVIGKSITLDGEEYTVVGIAPRSLRPDPYPETQIWIPIHPIGPMFSGAIVLTTFGRLKPSASEKSANADLYVAIQNIRAADPSRQSLIGQTAVVVSMRRWETSDLSVTLPIIMAALVLFLAIACANLANLLLAWMITRRREWATRLALGASRSRIAQQVLIESFVLALSGVVGGLILAWLSLMALRHFSGRIFPYGTALHLDFSAIAYSLILCILTAAVFGAASTFAALRTVSSDLHASAQDISGARRRQLGGRLLVIFEIASSLTLVCCAGLLLRTFYNLQRQDLGIQVGHVLAFETAAPNADYPKKQIGEAYYLPLLEKLRTLPGVVSAGASNKLPIESGPSTALITAPGHVIPPGTRFALRAVMPGYFQTMGIQMLRGREFTDADRLKRPEVAVINDIAAKLVFGNEDPIGQEIGPGYLIVGIYKFAKQGVHNESRLPEIDRCLMQVLPGSLVYDAWVTQPITVVLRVATEPSSLFNSIREATRQVDPRQPVFNIRTLNEDLNNTLVGDRLTLDVVGTSAILALILAVGGIYGVLTYYVAQRAREIAVRMALGAALRDIVGLIVRQTLQMIVLGIAVGSLGVLWAVRFIRGLLFHVSAFDPTTYLFVGGIVLLTGLTAALVPAVRAAHIDPAQTLKSE